MVDESTNLQLAVVTTVPISDFTGEVGENAQIVINFGMFEVPVYFFGEVGSSFF